MFKRLVTSLVLLILFFIPSNIAFAAPNHVGLNFGYEGYLGGQSHGFRVGLMTEYFYTEEIGVSLVASYSSINTGMYLGEPLKERVLNGGVYVKYNAFDFGNIGIGFVGGATVIHSNELIDYETAFEMSIFQLSLGAYLRYDISNNFSIYGEVLSSVFKVGVADFSLIENGLTADSISLRLDKGYLAPFVCVKIIGKYIISPTICVGLEVDIKNIGIKKAPFVDYYQLLAPLLADLNTYGIGVYVGLSF